jgi:hypothetical protein
MDTTTRGSPSALSNQVVGNVGLYYVCYRLSLAGWNAMPTARNARGIDIVLYSGDGQRFSTVQVKTLSNRAPVPLGKHLDHLFAAHFVICRRFTSERPECFVLTPDEVRAAAHKGEKNNKVTYWLQPKSYEGFAERWDRIGSGIDGVPLPPSLLRKNIVVAPQADAARVAQTSPERPPSSSSPHGNRSSVRSPVRLVHQIADAMSAKNPNVNRGEVIAECERQGVTYWTAHTQYGRWKAARKVGLRQP